MGRAANLHDGLRNESHANSRWLPHMVSTERLSERFGIVRPLVAAAVEAFAPSPVWRSDLGFLREPSERGGHLSFDWHPGSRSQSRLDSYRISAAVLRAEIARTLRGTPGNSRA